MSLHWAWAWLEQSVGKPPPGGRHCWACLRSHWWGGGKVERKLVSTWELAWARAPACSRLSENGSFLGRSVSSERGREVLSHTRHKFRGGGHALWALPPRWARLGCVSQGCVCPGGAPGGLWGNPPACSVVQRVSTHSRPGLRY